MELSEARRIDDDPLHGHNYVKRRLEHLDSHGFPPLCEALHNGGNGK